MSAYLEFPPSVSDYMNTLLYPVNTLRYSTQSSVQSLQPLIRELSHIRMHEERHIYSTVHTLLSVNRVIPEETYTCTHLHTYESVHTQTDSHRLLSAAYPRGRSPPAFSVRSEQRNSENNMKKEGDNEEGING